MKRCLYILPTNLEHEGITLKVKGQIAALSKHFRTTLHYLHYHPHSSSAQKLLAYIKFESLSFFYAVATPIIYSRYNPKSVIQNLWIVPLSWIKTVYIEHNTIMDTELHYMGRHLEHKIHLLTLQWLRLGRCRHIAVNHELKQHLKAKGLSRCVYAQNGYQMPPDTDYDTHILDTCQSFKEKVQYLALFCGSGRRWHGLEEVIDLVSQDSDIGLIVVGPYDSKDSENCLTIPHLNSATLGKLISLCDFAISTFRWDLIQISEGSPLKSRQYLCHGCPVLVNYYDCASDCDDLKPYIIDYRQHGAASLKKLKTLKDEDIAPLAQKALSWDIYINTILNPRHYK